MVVHCRAVVCQRLVMVRVLNCSDANEESVVDLAIHFVCSHSVWRNWLQSQLMYPCLSDRLG